jgi:hypothetical protein
MNNEIEIESIEVQTDHLVIRNMKITGLVFEAVMRATLENKNPEELIRSLLNLGAIAQNATSGQQLMNQVVTHMGSEVQKFTENVSREATENFPKVLENKTKIILDQFENNTKNFVNHELGKYLDPNQITSLRNQVNQLMNEELRKVNLFMVEEISKLKITLSENHTSISEQIKTSLGFKDSVNQGSKTLGDSFEEKVFNALTSIAGTDSVTDVSDTQNGRLSDQGHGKSGDFLVESVDLFDASKKISFVVEAKYSSKTKSKNSAIKEIGKNRQNRNVHVGIIVYPSVDVAPNKKRFSVISSNEIVAVLDDSTSALEAAYIFAKNITRYFENTDNTNIPKNILEKTIKEVEGKLDLEKELKKSADAIKKQLDSMIINSLEAKKELFIRLNKILEN